MQRRFTQNHCRYRRHPLLMLLICLRDLVMRYVTFILDLHADSQIWLKREDLQPVFSFKIRGAYNMMAHLTSEEKTKGVITCSAGTRIARY